MAKGKRGRPRKIENQTQALTMLGTKKMSQEELNRAKETQKLVDEGQNSVRTVDLDKFAENSVEVYADMVKSGAFDDGEIQVTPVANFSEDDPFEEKTFVTCSNHSCDVKAGCMRFRRRYTGLANKTNTVMYRDQSNCFIAVTDEKYANKLPLDPIEDVI